jgi:phospholipid/cholesterol/gamma-HCH transport system substrate-binding protein
MTNKKIQPAMIGLFVVLSLTLFLIAIIIFGGNKFFSKEKLIITYFEGSLNGLSVGAPVTYRGVTVGQVKDIKIHINATGQQRRNIIIPVLISLSAGETLIVNGPDTEDEDDFNIFMESMCQQGLRAKLKLQSLVTGKRYIDLAFYENTVAVYRDKEGKYFEIPTLPSEMQQFSRMMENINLDELFQKFIRTMNSLEKLSSGLAEALDKEKIQHLIDDLLAATANLNSILSQVDTGVAPILQKMDSGLEQFSTLATHADEMILSLDQQIKPLATDMSATFAHIETTLQQVDTLLAQAEKTITPNSPFYYQFTEAMRQLEETARSIEKLSDFIHRNPNTLIFGLQKIGEGKDEK